MNQPKEKPTAKLLGTNSNVFNLASIVGNALKRAGLQEQRDEFYQRLKECPDYDAALRLMMEYVEVE